jgi:hypothetical protein
MEHNALGALGRRMTSAAPKRVWRSVTIPYTLRKVCPGWIGVPG